MLVIGVILLGAGLDGCSPGETTPPKAAGTPSPAVSPAATDGPGAKGGRPKVDTTSRRELQKKRAEERAKGH